MEAHNPAATVDKTPTPLTGWASKKPLSSKCTGAPATTWGNFVKTNASENKQAGEGRQVRRELEGENSEH